MRQWQRWGVKLPEQSYFTDSNNLKVVGLGGMVKLTELPLTYRHVEDVKVNDTHWPKGKKTGCKYVSCEHMDEVLPVYRQHLTHLVIQEKRGKPV